jgi:aquaporin Z
MGLTAVLLIYSPWGQRSGAHMNPAVTLTFLRLGKIARWDAVFFIAAQFIGGTLGVLLIAVSFGAAFVEPPVSYVVTVPGPSGIAVAFFAELVISAVLMLAILVVSNTPHLARYTGIIAGCLVATYISIEAPLSGMSMNPARSFASALPAQQWNAFWIYLTAPVVGMLAAAQLHRRAHCAKLLHPGDQRCIHCGFEPVTAASPTQLRKVIS